MMIKQSSIKNIEKQVFLWSSVIIGKNFPSQVKKTKLTYKTDQFLNKQDFPKVVKEIDGGIIFKLPLIGVKDALDNLIDINALHSDDQLVDYLEDWLDNHRKDKNNDS